jgi:hypothetical protein
MGDWFKQIFVQGLVVGVAAALLVYLPWGWAKIILLVLLTYLLVMMGRNPMFFYRQIIRTLALASVLILGMSGHFTGRVSLSEDWGVLHYAVEIGGASPGWFVLALAICVAADFGFAWFQERKNRNLVGAIALDMPVARAKRGMTIHREFTLTGQKDAFTLTGAKLRVGAFGKPNFLTGLAYAIADGPENPIEDGHHLTVAAGQLFRLIIDAAAEKGRFTAILGMRLAPPANFIFPVRGRLELLRGTEPPITIPVRLTG